eukprot:1479882-Karenia_brevis.AAC.1
MMKFCVRIMRFHLGLKLELPIQNDSRYTIRGKLYPYRLTMDLARIMMLKQKAELMADRYLVPPVGIRTDVPPALI